MRTAPPKYGVASSAAILLAVAALLGAVALSRVAEFLMTTAQAKVAASEAIKAANSEPNGVEAQLAEAKSAAETLKKENLFVPPPPKQNPVREILGILGSEALIDGKWYKAGDRVGDAEIVAIEPTKVKVSWNGKEEEFAPLGAGGGPGGESGPGMPGPGRMKPPGSPPNMPGRGMRRARGGGAQPSAEERAAFRDRFRNASPEERAKLREEMRRRFAPPER